MNADADRPALLPASRFVPLALVAVAVLSAGCVPGARPALVDSAPPATTAPAPDLGGDAVQVDPGWSQVGEASWYGPGFAGRRTANGEIFDPSELTAAHRTLPFGARVRVTNLENGRSVVVRINDRGPFAHGRVIDLSRAAAQAVQMLGSGVAQVRVEPAATEGLRPLRVDERLRGYDVIVPGLPAGYLIVLRSESGSEVLARTVDLPVSGADATSGDELWASAGLAERLGPRAFVVVN